MAEKKETTEKKVQTPAAKPETKTTAKPLAKQEAKSAAKPAAKPETKTTAKPAAKPETKTTAKPAAKPAAKADVKDDDKVYHISRRRSDHMWQVKAEGAPRALKKFFTQDEAVEYAKTVANNNEGRIVIHKVDGSFKKLKY